MGMINKRNPGIGDGYTSNLNGITGRGFFGGSGFGNGYGHHMGEGPGNGDGCRRGGCMRNGKSYDVVRSLSNAGWAGGGGVWMGNCSGEGVSNAD